MQADAGRTGLEVPIHPIVYQQGKRKTVVEPLGDALAVRPRDGVEEAVSQALHSLGQVRPNKSQRLFVLELRKDAPRDAAWQAVQQLFHDGKIAFATPVLRDTESRLHQILTDEITIRFQSDLSPERLQSLEEKYGLSVARRNEFVPRQFIMKVEHPLGLHPLEVASKLDAEEDVEFAAPNFISEFRR